MTFEIRGRLLSFSADTPEDAVLAKKYFASGISTNHECTALREAKAQIELGAKIWIRRGSAADDFEALWPLVDMYPGQVGLCTDDLHSPIFLGSDDEMIAEALNLVIETKGGLALVTKSERLLLPLPICGLMSTLSAEEVAGRYAQLEHIVSADVSNGAMTTPFMTLSFMGLIVIPDYGIGDDCVYKMGEKGPEPLATIFRQSA